MKCASLKWLEMHLNCPPWLEKFLKFTLLQMARNTLKLSTMVGEIFEIYLSQMAKSTRKLSTMVGEMFKIYFSQMAKSTQIIHYGRRNFWNLLISNG